MIDQKENRWVIILNGKEDVEEKDAENNFRGKN